MFPIGPVSRNTLFQIHVEKILARSRRYGAPIPFYVMTSPATHDETAAFFAEHDRFGLAEEDLEIFCQGTMPVVDAATGRVLLAERDAIALSPDGHGGMLAALAGSGALEHADGRGIRQLFYFQVDNPLVDVGSPEMIGYHLLLESEMSTQVIGKQDPLERVGNVVEVDGRLRVIEYSDLPDDVAERRHPNGSLAIWAGSIAVHVFEASFLHRMADRADALPFHIARKKVAHVDDSGAPVAPAEPNAIKFERFIFDLMPSAENAVVVEIDPAEGFAPLKNAAGAKDDTPEVVRTAMAAGHRRWLREAGAEVADRVAVEICPLWALDSGQVAEKLPPGTRVTEPRWFR
jgi:UDP-N-acetylglucosamine/UDP-N-acetylgalactosamine diphosphorylase